MPWRRIAISAAIVVGGLIVLGRVSGFLVDWLWFSSIGYPSVFWTIIAAQAMLFIAVFVASAGAVWLSGLLALRYAGRSAPARSGAGFPLPQTLPEILRQVSPRLPWRLFIGGVALLLGLSIAAGEISSWDIALRFFNQIPYGKSDPVFGNDIGFYLFSLPVYVSIKNWLLLLLFCSAAVAGAVYWARGDIALDRRPPGLSRAAIVHASALLGVFFALKAWSYGLDRYLLLYDDNGVVVGAGYTDLHVELPVLWLLMGVAIAAAVASWANMRWSTYWIPTTAVISLF